VPEMPMPMQDVIPPPPDRWTTAPATAAAGDGSRRSA
jgi:hypothetical protein